MHLKETGWFENRLVPIQTTPLLNPCGTESIYARQYNLALNRFNSTLFGGKIFRLTRKFLNRRPYLYDLNALKPELHVRGSFYAGIKVVRIDSIIGSEGRLTDFDMDFHPMDESARERWISMAVAHLSRTPLPPVQLIRVGDAYFVRDGHHRISVSRAFGQLAMDAEVIVWNAAPPFPWQPRIQVSNKTLLTQRS